MEYIRIYSTKHVFEEPLSVEEKIFLILICAISTKMSRN